MHIPPPLIAVSAAVALYVGHRLLPGLAWPWAGWWLPGAFLMMAGAALASRALLGFRRAGTTHRPDRLDRATILVVEGPYRFTRNPMYLGLALITTGFGVGLGTVLTPLVAAIFVWTINVYQIFPEEKALAESFGDAYENYRRQVRRWI